MTATLTGAYGRDYQSKGAVLADFEANRDFVLHDISSPYDGKYVNKSDLQIAGIKQVKIRYRTFRSVIVVDIKGD